MPSDAPAGAAPASPATSLATSAWQIATSACPDPSSAMFSTEPAVGRAVAVAPCRPHTSASPRPRPWYTPPCGPVAITTDTPRSGAPHPTTDARTTSPATSTARAAHPRRRAMPTPSKDTPNPASMPPPSVRGKRVEQPMRSPRVAARPTDPPTTRPPHDPQPRGSRWKQAQGFTNTLAASPTRSRHSRYRPGTGTVRPRGRERPYRGPHAHTSTTRSPEISGVARG